MEVHTGKREDPLEERPSGGKTGRGVADASRTKPRSPYATLPRDVISRVATFTIDTAPSPDPTEKEPVTWAFMRHFPTTGDVTHLVPASPLAQHAFSRLASRLEEDKQLFPHARRIIFYMLLDVDDESTRGQYNQAFPGPHLLSSMEASSG